jgi:hypothetical protein
MTTKYGDLTPNTFASGMSTGNADVDRLLELETTKMAGFSLRQTVSIRLTPITASAANSQLKMSQRTVLREMQVSAIRELESKPSDFAIPAGFQPASVGERPKTQTQVLTFEPGK